MIQYLYTCRINIVYLQTGAPNVKTLAPSGELTPDKKITVEGYVLDRNCKPISGAIVHAWDAGGNSGMI